MQEIDIAVDKGRIAGAVDARFDAVAEAFEANFVDNNEIGASVCVRVDGETVVDLWGGLANPADSTPWERDTLSIVFSCTKGVEQSSHREPSCAALRRTSPIPVNHVSSNSKTRSQSVGSSE